MPQSENVVSVIIPTHNRAQLLSRALASVLSQNYDPMEVIIVDDASTDNTSEVIAAIDDPRVRVLRHDSNRGGAAARNTGIRASRGAFIAFLDSDDEWLPGKLEKQIAAFAEVPPSVGVVYSRFYRMKLSGESSLRPQFPGVEREGKLFEPLLRRNFVFFQVSVVRRECFEAAGMLNESLRRFHDWEFWLRLARHFDFRFIDEPLAVVHSQRDCISASSGHGERGLRFILDTYLDQISRDPKLLACYYYRIGKMLQADRRYAEARDAYGNSFRAWPWRLQPLVRYFLSAAKALAGSNDRP